MIDFCDGELANHEVRLFPSIRISSEGEAEQRATAALLAIIKGVTEFGRAIVKLAGGPAGRISCYTEVCFPPFEPEGPKPRPDGIIRAVRGDQDWKALVEVKVANCPLEQAQFDIYQRLARDHDFQAVITISSQAARPDGLPPIVVDGRRLRAVPVVHFSWDQLLSEARLLTQQDGIADADQRWMLSEWIRYVEDENSRIVQAAQLGQHWNEILKAAREANLPSVAKYVAELVQLWEDYLKKGALQLRAQLGVDVHVLIPLRERKDPDSRTKRMHADVLERRCLTGVIRIPDAASDVAIEVGLQARVVRFTAELEAPVEGRQQTRVSWLIRQFRNKNVPGDLVVKVEWDKKGLVSQSTAADAQKDLAYLLRDGHNQAVPSDAMPRSFALEWTRPLQNARARSTAPVLKGISTDLEKFYGLVVQVLEAYVPAAPKLSKEPAQETSTPEAKPVQAIEPSVDAASLRAPSQRPAALPDAEVTRVDPAG